MHACRTLCFPITELWLHTLLLTKLSALLGQETTKITSLFGLHNGTTDPCCMPQIQQPGCLQQTDSWVGTLCHCLGHYLKAVQVYDAWKQTACMFTVCVSQQHRWSDLLLAVMLAGEGGEESLLLYLQDSNTPAVARPGAAKWPAVTWSKLLLAHDVDSISVSAVNIWGVN